jgi:hypothetical protein
MMKALYHTGNVSVSVSPQSIKADGGNTTPERVPLRMVLGAAIARNNSTNLAGGLIFWFADADLDVQY